MANTNANPIPASNTEQTVQAINSVENELLERRNQMLDRIQDLTDELNDLSQAVDHINGFLKLGSAEDDTRASY